MDALDGKERNKIQRLLGRKIVGAYLIDHNSQAVGLVLIVSLCS